MSKAKQAAYAAAAQQSSSSSSGAYGFASGFLLGQLTLAFILFLFIKFFIFGEPPSADVRAATRANHRRQRTLSHASSLRMGKRRHSASTQSTLHRKSSLLGLNAPATRIGGSVNNILTTEQILAKTYYNVDGHQPESLDWFNVLIAQTIAQLRADALQDNAALDSLVGALNGPGKPHFIDDIRVTDISLGEEFPIFSNCRVIPVDENGAVLPTNDQGRRGGAARGERVASGESRLQARMDVDLSDVVTLGIETKLLLNYPKPFSAVLPVALTVSVVRFSGTLSLSFTPSQDTPAPSTAGDDKDNDDATSASSTKSPTTLNFTFLDDYRLDLSVHSLIGSRSRLQDVPKIAQLIEQRIHNWFDERCVEPRFQQIVLPSLWPRKKNVRGGAEDAAAAATAASTATGTTTIPGSLPTPSPSPPPPSSSTEKRSPSKQAPPSTQEWAKEQADSKGNSKGGTASALTPGHDEDREDRGLRRRKSDRRKHPTGLGVSEDELELAGAEMRAAEEREWERERRSRERARTGGPSKRATS
ncbi:hypothetical protein BDV97DRAFT_357325 [Delphinella strobiligena]|nr:hypothetical protein BDV97DRAFT_357325 [Delphinella strobiligena]